MYLVNNNQYIASIRSTKPNSETSIRIPSDKYAFANIRSYMKHTLQMLTMVRKNFSRLNEIPRGIMEHYGARWSYPIPFCPVVSHYEKCTVSLNFLKLPMFSDGVQLLDKHYS